MGLAGPAATGPIHVFAGVGNGGAMLYLGTGKRAPRWVFECAFIPFHNDLGGSVIPFDEIYAGTRGLISMDLNRFDRLTLNRVESVPNFLNANAGAQGAFDQGTMMIQEGAAYPLVMTFPYFSKPAYRALGMPPGIRFLACWAMGPDGWNNNGTDAQEINLIWAPTRRYIPATGGWLLADNVVAGLPPIE